MMADRKRRIAALLVCHNRRTLTLRALRSLATGNAFEIDMILFDDGSTDGTAEAVHQEFPSAIVLKGDGTAFWNGGLHRAWGRALELPVDGFLWLNDDVSLDPDAMDRLAATWENLSLDGSEDLFILVGATRGADGNLTYGGHLRSPSPLSLRLSRLPIADVLTRVDTFNGNIVLIPSDVVGKIGINDPAYFHAFGDIDYGLTATKAGIRALVLPATLGECEVNRSKGFSDPNLSFRQRWKLANSHLGLPFAGWWRLTRRHSGIWFPLHFLMAYRDLVTPRFLRKRHLRK